MSLSLAGLKLRLLDILFIEEVDALADIGPLDDQDWSTLQAMAREHRLLPLLHWRLSRDLPELPVPQSLRDTCSRAFKAATLRALTLQRELFQIHRILESAGIPYLALKGAWLAFHAYPQPGMRPLRDLDILVPESKVLVAFQALLDGGCSRIDQYNGSPEACAKQEKHLPPLHSPSGRITVELHARLYHLDTQTSGDFELSRDDGFWQRSITEDVGGVALTYLAPTEQLLHLIVHAVYDHQFNNGPLLISDLVYLLKKSPIDWPRFWSLARRGGHERGAILALRLVERYSKQLEIEWPERDELALDVSTALLDSACELMLRNFEARYDVTLEHDINSQKSMMGKATFLLRKVFPPKSDIATAYPVSEHSIWIYAWYPVKWWWLLGTRVPEFIRSKGQGRFRDEMSQLTQLNSWLKRAA